MNTVPQMSKCVIFVIYAGSLLLQDSATQAHSLPSFIKRCNWSSPIQGECLKERSNEVIQRWDEVVKSLPDLKMPSLNPLLVKHMEATTAPGQPNSIEMVFDDVKVTGFDKIRLTKFQFLTDQNRFLMGSNLPEMNATCSYKMKGKFLLFELNTGGKAIMNVREIVSDTLGRYDLVKRNGKTYIAPKQTEKVEIKFKNGGLFAENLIPGNPQLSEQVNKAINDNFEQLSASITPLISQSVDSLVIKLLQPFFDYFALDELFEI